MAGKSMTNVWTFVIIIFLVVVFILGIQNYVSELLINPNYEVTQNELEDYLLPILGADDLDLSQYNVSIVEGQQDPTKTQGNESGSQLKDFAIEFFFARSIKDKIWSPIKAFFLFPSFIAKLLKIPNGVITWIVNPLNWLWNFAMLLALYYLIRGTHT